jgi:hypothetical protein
MIELGGPKRDFQLQQSLLPHLPPSFLCAALPFQQNLQFFHGIEKVKEKSHSSSK